MKNAKTKKKVYLVIMLYSTNDCDGLDTKCFDTYKKAIRSFNKLVKNQKNPDSSWLENAFEDNVLQDDYKMDCSPKYTDGLEHELWWELIHKEDWNLHTFIELRILEIQ